MPNYGLGPTPATGQLYTGALQGQLFRGGNQAVVATAMTAGLPTAYTGGLVLWNPVASPNNLIIQRAKAAFIIAQTNASVIGLGVGPVGVAPTGTLTVVPSQQSYSASAATASGILYSSASITLPAAPVLAEIIGTVNTGAETTEVDSVSLTSDLQGGIIIPPGAFACFTSTATGTASSFFGSFTWLELPA